MGQLRAHLLLALSVTVGSALPFVPTGEMVSGAAAGSPVAASGVGHRRRAVDAEDPAQP